MTPSPATSLLLQHRGPDATGEHRVTIHVDSAHVHATFLSTVLALRGKDIVQQPLQDAATASVLCWNGKAWSISGDAVNGNDSQLIFSKLLAASVDQNENSTRRVVELLAAVRGPYAFVFYDAPNKRVYYGRDCLGRRSLLRKHTADGTLILSSVCDNAPGEAWAEVDADGIYVVDLGVDTLSPSFSDKRIPHCRLDQDEDSDISFVGECSNAWVLLTYVDPAFSSHELRRLRGHCFGFGCGRATEDIVAQITTSPHRACP